MLCGVIESICSPFGLWIVVFVLSYSHWTDGQGRGQGESLGGGVSADVSSKEAGVYRMCVGDGGRRRRGGEEGGPGFPVKVHGSRVDGVSGQSWATHSSHHYPHWDPRYVSRPTGKKIHLLSRSNPLCVYFWYEVLEMCTEALSFSAASSVTDNLKRPVPEEGAFYTRNFAHY